MAADPNCTDFTPQSQDFLKVLTTAELVLLIICGVLCAINIIIFIDNLVFLWRKHAINKIREAVAIVTWLVGLCPALSLICLLSMIMPNAYIFRDVLITVCLSTVMYKFVELNTALLDHFTVLRDSLEETGVFVFNVFPACCCVCLPHARVHRKRLRLFKGLVLQYPVVCIILTVVTMYTWLDDKYELGEFSVDNPYPYLSTTRAISALTAIYAMGVLFNLCKEILRGLYVQQKYLALKLCIFLFNIQHLVFRIMSATDVFHTKGCFKSRDFGNFYENMVYSIEIFLVSLLNLWTYRRPFAEHEITEVSGAVVNTETTYSTADTDNRVADSNGSHGASTADVTVSTKKENLQITDKEEIGEQ